MFLRNGKNMKTAITIVTMLVLCVYPNYLRAADKPPPVPSEEQPEVLTSGPVHEAFAEPVNLQVQQGLVAPKAPIRSCAGILGMGRGSQRLYMGQRMLASSAAKYLLGAGILGQSR